MVNSTRLNLLVSCFIAVLGACQNHNSHPDHDFNVTVTAPQLSGHHVIFDQGHNNHHLIERSYKPFATLIKNDGGTVSSTQSSIDSATLTKADVYVIVAASGKEDPGEQSPFTAEEIDMLEDWVINGGSALIVTEHYPFGIAMESLLSKFGVIVHNGYTEDSTLINKKVADALLFEKSKKLIHQSHPITLNVNSVNTFTGSSVKGDSTWTRLLILSDHAQNYNVDVEVEKDGGDTRVNVSYSDYYPASGYAQGICKSYGRGKVVILSESALLTAQIDKNGNRFGMNIPDADNKEFGLNIIRWLANKL